MRIAFPSGVKWITQSNSNEQTANYPKINNLNYSGEGILAEPQKAGQDKNISFYIDLQPLTLFDTI
jgi:hypothetical protein